MCVMYSKGYHSTTFSLTHHVLDPRERCWLWGSSWGDGGGDAGRAGLPPRGTRRAVARDGSGRTAAVEATRGGGGARPCRSNVKVPSTVECAKVPNINTARRRSLLDSPDAARAKGAGQKLAAVTCDMFLPPF